MGVTLYAVGIGPDANEPDLLSITGGGSNTVKMVEYDTLQTAVTAIKQMACALQGGSCSTAYAPESVNSDPSAGSKRK